MMLPGDADAVKGARMKRDSLRRAWRFSAPYKWHIVGFLVAIVAAIVTGLALEQWQRRQRGVAP